jgi:hypothetical protein
MNTATKKASATEISSSAVFSFGDTMSMLYLMTGGVSKEW